MTTTALAEFNSALDSLAAQSSSSASKLLTRMDRLSTREAMTFMSDAYPQMLDPFLRASSELTAQWYAEQPTRPRARGSRVFTPEIAPLPVAQQLSASARWSLTQKNPVAAISGNADRNVRNASRRTVVSNAIREGVGWVRVARPDACGFCRMLATRTGKDGLYASERSALLVVGAARVDRRTGKVRGHTGTSRRPEPLLGEEDTRRKTGEEYHDRCKCQAVAVRDGIYVPPDYVQEWRDQYDLAVEEYGNDVNEIAKALDPPRKPRLKVPADKPNVAAAAALAGGALKVSSVVADQAARRRAVAAVRAAAAAMKNAASQPSRLKSAPELILSGVQDAYTAIADLPDIAEPRDEELDFTFFSEVDNTWLGNGFDAVKWDMRDGADEALANGYTGPPEDLIGWKLTNFLRTSQGRKVLGAELVARAVHSEPTEQALWRGMKLSPDDLDDLKSQKSVTMQLSSFTPNYGVAKRFADPDEYAWTSYDLPEDGVPVVLKLEPGAKAAKLGENREKNPAKEHVAFGRFEIVGVEENPKGGGPTEVWLRQVSLDTSEVLSGVEDYGMDHRPAGPDDDGIPIHNLTANLPDDVYEHPEYYASSDEEKSNWDVFRRVRDKPTELVSIFRSVPRDKNVTEINKGDWVAIRREYAEQHGMHESDPELDDPVIHARVPASSLFTSGDSLDEFGYWGPTVSDGGEVSPAEAAIARLGVKDGNTLGLEENMGKRLGAEAVARREAGLVNPGWKPKSDPTASDDYRNNCAYAVVAYELRRRDFDVIAATRQNGLPAGKLPKVFRRGSAGGNYPAWMNLDIPSVRTHRQGTEGYILNNWPDGARGFVGIEYAQEHGGGGHVFVAEKIDGKVVFLDPQVSGPYQKQIDAASSFDLVRKTSDVMVLRTDDLFLGPEVADMVNGTVNEQTPPTLDWLEKNAPGGFLDAGKKVPWTAESIRRWWWELEGSDTLIGERWIRDRDSNGLDSEPKLSGVAEEDFDPVKVTADLRNEFYEWLEAVPESDLDPDMDENNPLGHWPTIERFLEDRFPAAHRGFMNGQEDASHWLDQDLDADEWSPMMENEDDYPEPYSSADAESLGYDPQEVAAGMVLLHNRAHSGRQDSFLEKDKARLADIYRKRVEMQRAADKRAAGPVDSSDWDQPRDGEGFDAWRNRLWDGLSQDGRTFNANATGNLFRAMSEDEYRAGVEAGEFRPLIGDHLYVSDEPDRLSGGSYGAKGGGYIVEFAPIPTEDIPSYYNQKLRELGVRSIPMDAVRRVWKWNGEDHVPQDGVTLAGRVEPSTESSYEYAQMSRPTGESAAFRDKQLVGTLKKAKYPDEVDFQLYHGSRQDFAPGDLVEPGHPGNFVRRMKHVYASDAPGKSKQYGGKVYEVRPTGPIGHRRDARPEQGYFASEWPFEVVRVIPADELDDGEDLILTGVKDGGPGSAPVSGEFGKVASRLPEGTEIKPVYKRNKDGSIKMTTPKPKDDGTPGTPKPQVDVQATWAAVSDDTLDENLRQALRQAQPWAVEAGTTWYPGVRKMATRMTKTYAASFKEQHGIELSPDILGGLISVFSRNNGWIRNAVGVRQYLDDPFAEKPKKDKKTGKTKMVKPMHVDMTGGAEDLIAFVKARHAAGDTDDHAIVEAFFASYPTAPKPHRFWRSIMGDEDNSAIDRWMARVQLHTDDPEFAEKMRSATKTEKGVKNNYGYHRLEASIKRISREPEFAGFTATQLQAMPWVHLVGPDGVLGDIQDLSSDKAASAEAKRHTESMGWKD